MGAKKHIGKRRVTKKRTRTPRVKTLKKTGGKNTPKISSSKSSSFSAPAEYPDPITPVAMEDTVPAPASPNTINAIGRHVATRVIPTILQNICKDPDLCLALGQQHDKIMEYFNDFTDLQYVDNSKIKRLGTDSSNGFILEVPFVKNGFTAYTMLKCSQNKAADNLLYEFIVGKFINQYIMNYPCFVETYGCFVFNDDTSWAIAKDYSVSNRPLDLKQMISPYNQPGREVADSCSLSKRICISIQHFNKFTTLINAIKHHTKIMRTEIYNILYQVYFVLDKLKDVYTHYDLHTSNVCLYLPFEPNQYMVMHYHLANGNIISFPAEYLVKMIDYGRNYFYGDVNENSTRLIQTDICPSQQCAPNCGYYDGYSVIQGTADTRTLGDDFIDPINPNPSHDLRLAYLCQQLLHLPYTVKFGDHYQPNEKRYGTAEMPDNIDCITNPETCVIQTVSDMCGFLEEIISNYNVNPPNKYDQSWKQVAEMHVYHDGRPYTYKELSKY
jgi:hypothetical protein